MINGMGKLIAGGFKDGVKPLDSEEERKMWYMQSALEMSMKKEFGNNLGDINYIVTYRDNVTLINMPIQGHVALLSTEGNADIRQIVDRSRRLFDFNNKDATQENRDLLTSKSI